MGVVRRASESVRLGLGMRHTLGRLLVTRDLSVFLRVECLGALARSGIAPHLRRWRTASELASAAELTDVELTAALLDLAVSLRVARRRGDRYRIRGLRGRAIASGRAPDVEGLAEEALAFDGPIYAALPEHLRGLPSQPYDALVGDVIAKVSRVAEPLCGPWLASFVASRKAASALDVGCGSGVNLSWLARGLPTGARLQGMDRDPRAVALAQEPAAALSASVVQADLDDLPADLRGPWDVVLLAQNIYYWPPEDRSALLARLRPLIGERGAVVALTAVPGRVAIGRHLDLVLRVTEGNHRLPTPDELRADAEAAGYEDVEVVHLAPLIGMVALVASGGRTGI